MIALLIALALAPPALAQPIKEAPVDKQDAAAAHFQLGVNFYRAGDYGAARVEFEAAYGLSSQPDLLHNLSLTAEKQGRYREAIDFEERWLNAARSTLTAEEVDQARGRLLRLQELDRTAPPTQAPANPGKAPTVGGPGWRPPVGAVALAAVGGAVLLAGVACGGGALATSAHLYSGQAFTLREIEALNAQGQVLNGAAIGLDVLGGLSLAGGGVWLLTDWKRSRERAAVGR